MREDGNLLNKFDKVYKNTGCKQNAIVTVARRLIMKVHTVIKHGEDYVISMPVIESGKAA